jgi:F-box and leucine-rich repeat protein 14
VTRVESVADIDALPTDTTAVLVVRLDDRKIGALGRLNALRRLYQEGPSQVTDSDLCYLVNFPLELLDLGESPQITDRGLSELRLIRSLRWLDVTGCRQLTEAGIQELQAALPRCEIVA